MANFQDQKNKSVFARILESWPMILLFSFFLFLMIFGVYDLFQNMQDTRKNRILAEDKIQELEERKVNLMTDIENLSTDEGKEKIFRENFGLGKEGEGVIVIVEDQSLANIENEESKSGFFSFFTNLFK